jgi:hypothetical protein
MSKTMDNDSKNHLADALDNAFAKKDAEIERLKAELEVVREHSDEVIKRNRELSAELQALKPKPVVEVRYYAFDTLGLAFRASEDLDLEDNLKLTFTDGKLTGAEVVG